MLSAKARIAARLVAVALLAAPAAGCFTPMYAEHADGSPGTAREADGRGPSADSTSRTARARPASASRSATRWRSSSTATPPACRRPTSWCCVSTTRASLIVDPNTQLPSSENYGIDAQFNLVELATNKSVMTGTTFSRVTYDMPGSYQRFARSRAFRDAEDRAAQEIADNIQTRIASYFTAGT